MKCEHCGNDILATMQISWRGSNYHPDCVGEAVAQYRAAETQEDREIKEELQSFDNEFEEQFDNEFEENFDGLEPEEEPEERRVIVPEIVHQVSTNGEVVGAFEMPQGAMIAAPRAIIHPPTNGHGSLVAGLKGSRYVEYPELKTLPLPETTSTFKPVAFYEFVTKLLQGLWDRRMKVVNDQYIISADGMKLFGLIELENEFNGVRFAVGLRTSNDKSTKLALAVGYRVMCCSNGMLHGDYLPLSVKHSANLELDDALALGIDRVRRKFGDLESAIQHKQQKLIGDGTAKECIYNAFTAGKFPVSLFRTVHSEYFEKPSYDEFRPRTLFSLENAFTTAMKKLQPMQQFEQTARLGKFLAEYN